jgi:hypothetical protein
VLDTLASPPREVPPPHANVGSLPGWSPFSMQLEAERAGSEPPGAARRGEPMLGRYTDQHSSSSGGGGDRSGAGLSRTPLLSPLSDDTPLDHQFGRCRVTE